ncbi:GT2 family glycosyltransferase [Mycoplana sp. BE70]|uniref:glycosyltransferase family 2 protein n=1 Tax=Mycoplana sp. BE70 TaxID=2817775 RepID=UPI002855E31E|nr:glycosyltransferase family 2 protein [Mycoplana sp. BE70]MDR6759619.1 GT2 family glycosyltransferase [Mycoplana sp. BE70]
MDALRTPSDDPRASQTPSPVKGTAGIAVVIVTYNSEEVLPGLLDSLAEGLEGLTRRDVIVVDNDSRDASVELARAHPFGVRVIETGRNAGFAAGINAAAATTDKDMHLLVLNPDIRLHRGAAARLVARLDDPSIGVVAPQMLNEDGMVAQSLRREPSLMTAWSDALAGTRLAARLGLGEIVADPLLYRTGGKVDWATGAALAVSARSRSVVGDWDDSFFLYSEEVDYMQRVRRAGLAVVYDTQARTTHIGGAYHNDYFLSTLMTKNRIRYFRRHHGALATALFRLSIVVGETMRMGLGAGHRAALRAALGGSLRQPGYGAPNR